MTAAASPSRATASRAGTAGLDRLLGTVAEVLAEGDRGSGDAMPGLLCPVLAAALADPYLLPEAVASHRPSSGFAKHLLHAGPEFSIFATLTAPGTSLPIHDHGSWGVVGVYRGVEEETRFEASSQLLPAEPMLVEVDRVVHVSGEVMPVRPPPADIHAVANPGLDWSVCIHLFAEDPLAEGFNLYLPPGFAPVGTGPLAYDSTPDDA